MNRRRILHVHHGMERGGIAIWLMHVLRHLNPEEFQVDFIVHLDYPGVLDEEARQLGARIFRCPAYRQPVAYAGQFMEIIRRHGPYDVVHSHCQRATGFHLFLAALCGVPIRIAHSHNDTRATRAKEGIWRKVYYRIMDALIVRYATIGLATSNRAAQDLFGEQWSANNRWRVMLCNLNFQAFHGQFDRNETLAELGLPSDVNIVGHVGRFNAWKNHLLILKIFSEALKRDPKLRLMFVGDGGTMEEQVRRAVQQSCPDKVLFLGSRSDVARLLLSCADVFLFPSTAEEGLGLALVEAQAAGLPCLISDVIPEEARIVQPLLRTLPLDLGVEYWADVLLETLASPRPFSRSDALAMVEQSPFNIKTSLVQLERIYSGANCS